jgi:hypothetical protein
MTFKPGDVVRTESGEVGKVVHTTRLTVFVALPTTGGDDSELGCMALDLRN